MIPFLERQVKRSQNFKVADCRGGAPGPALEPHDQGAVRVVVHWGRGVEHPVEHVRALADRHVVERLLEWPKLTCGSKRNQ